MSDGFSSRRVLVTGASGGLGRAVAKALLDRGARVIATGRSGDRLRQTQALSESHVVTVEAALEDATAREQIVEQTLAGGDALDGMVHCAGHVSYARAPYVTEDELDRHYRVNFMAPVMLTEMLAPALRRSRMHPGVVFVASTLALRAAPATLAYAASKAALLSAARSLALELAPSGIRVNALAPGVFDTPMSEAPRPQAEEVRPSPGISTEQLAAQKDELSALHALGRLGTPEEVAHAALFVLDATWMTGSVLTIDGGLLLR